MRKLILLLVTAIALSITLTAQPFTYSGYVYGANGQGLQNIPVKLFGKRTDPYEISFPTYSPAGAFNSGTVIPSSDDATHGPFNIGFTFSFFGNNYTQFYVGSNGWIGFSSAQTTGYTAQYIPNAGSPKNVIMADWEDLYPGSANIYYTTVGTSPNRKLIVSFNAVPHYGCRTNLHTFQFVLYESSNVIDVYYQDKPLCSGNNSTAGLVNVDNTNVVPVGGKNASAWSATNYAVRYTPAVPETSFSLKGTYSTSATGQYTINPNLDAQSYQFEIRLDSLLVALPTPTDAQYPTEISLYNITPTSKLYYTMDVNGDGRFTVTDSYNIYARINNRPGFWISPIADYRIFTPAQWTTINSGTTDMRGTIPGVQSMIISTPTNGGSTNFYLLRTGIKTQ